MSFSYTSQPNGECATRNISTRIRQDDYQRLLERHPGQTIAQVLRQLVKQAIEAYTGRGEATAASQGQSRSEWEGRANGGS